MNVRLILEMRFDAKAGQAYEARWYKARLVHADFKVLIGTRLTLRIVPVEFPLSLHPKSTIQLSSSVPKSILIFRAYLILMANVLRLRILMTAISLYMNGGAKSAYAIDLNGLNNFHYTSVAQYSMDGWFTKTNTVIRRMA